MKPLSKTGKIAILSLFSIVLLVTGSVVINMYINSTQTDRSHWLFQFSIGIGSILIGIGCIIYTVRTSLETKTGQRVQSVLVDQDV
jgi:hypothetical protein